jgi:PAB-dependent poly(A)-specific ribonuclease subunit 2
VLYLEREDVRSQLDFSGLPDELDPSILSRDTSISVFVFLAHASFSCRVVV